MHLWTIICDGHTDRITRGNTESIHICIMFVCSGLTEMTSRRRLRHSVSLSRVSQYLFILLLLMFWENLYYSLIFAIFPSVIISLHSLKWIAKMWHLSINPTGKKQSDDQIVKKLLAKLLSTSFASFSCLTYSGIPTHCSCAHKFFRRSEDVSPKFYKLWPETRPTL